MRIALVVGALLLAFSAHAIERKPIVQVDTNTLATDLQAMDAADRKLDLIWWIPVEFWEATFRQNQDLPEAQADEILGILRNHSVLAVVQADISTIGAFHFFEKDAVMSGLKIETIDADGKIQTISHTEPSDPDLRLMLDQLKPILSQAMGNLGQNLYFLPLPAFDDDGERMPSPYESGLVRVTLQRGETSSTLELGLPADSLFVPRLCPNGKPAHVSWAYCPWSGKKLPK